MKNLSLELLKEVKANFGGGGGGGGRGNRGNNANAAVASVANSLGFDSGANGHILGGHTKPGGWRGNGGGCTGNGNRGA